MFAAPRPCLRPRHAASLRALIRRQNLATVQGRLVSLLAAGALRSSWGVRLFQALGFLRLAFDLAADLQARLSWMMGAGAVYILGLWAYLAHQKSLGVPCGIELLGEALPPCVLIGLGMLFPLLTLLWMIASMPIAGVILWRALRKLRVAALRAMAQVTLVQQRLQRLIERLAQRSLQLALRRVSEIPPPDELPLSTYVPRSRRPGIQTRAP